MVFRIMRTRPAGKTTAQLRGELSELESAERGIQVKTPWVIKKGISKAKESYAERKSRKKMEKREKHFAEKAEKERGEELELFKEKQKVLTKEKKKRLKAEWKVKKEGRQQTLSPYVTFEQQGEVV